METKGLFFESRSTITLKRASVLGSSVVFDEILRRSLTDREHKGCMLVNAALEVAPHDPEFRKSIAAVLKRIETFFFTHIQRGQAEGTISRAIPAAAQAQHLLAILMGVRVLSRVRPEKLLLEGMVKTALATLTPDPKKSQI
jgi:TetR/AcrR family transcriptional repressor of nem operon